MIPLIDYALMLACGALTKATDELIDSRAWARLRNAGYATAVAYGAIAGFLVSGSPELATLILAMITGELFAGKIDPRQHQLGVAMIVIVAAMAGLPAINTAPFLLFTALCILDEVLNDLMDKLREKGKNMNRALRRFLNARLSLEIGTIAFGFWSGNFGYFIAILSFDLAYNIVGRAMRAKTP